MDYSTRLSARYECIVCHLNSSTIGELHRHQTYRHTTEELSLSTIGLRCSLNNGTLSDGSTYARSWLCNPDKRSEFYAYSSSLLNDPNNNSNFHCNLPVDYVLDKENFTTQRDSANSVQPTNNQPRTLQTCLQQRCRKFSYGVMDLSNKTCATKSPNEDTFENVSRVPNTKAKTKKKVVARRKKLTQRKTSIGKRKTLKSGNATEEFKRDKKINVNRQIYRSTRAKFAKVGSFNEDNLEEMDVENNEGSEKKAKRLRVKKTRRRRLRASRASKKRAKTTTIVSKSQVCSKLSGSQKVNNYWRKKNVSRAKGNLSPVRATTLFTERVNTSSECENQEEISRENANDEKADSDETCFDRTYYCVEDSHISSDKFQSPISETVETFSICPANEIPEVDYEVCVQLAGPDNSPPYCATSKSKIENFEKVETFPVYPRNMDERSILVFDPVDCKFVWTSFELTNDSTFENDADDDLREDIRKETSAPEYDSLALHDYVVTNPRSSNRLSTEIRQEDDRSSQEASVQRRPEVNDFPSRSRISSLALSRLMSRKSDQMNGTPNEEVNQHAPEMKRETLKFVENLGTPIIPLRSKRNRKTPDRYVPYRSQKK